MLGWDLPRKSFGPPPLPLHSASKPRSGYSADHYAVDRPLHSKWSRLFHLNPRRQSVNCVLTNFLVRCRLLLSHCPKNSNHRSVLHHYLQNAKPQKIHVAVAGFTEQMNRGVNYRKCGVSVTETTNKRDSVISCQIHRPGFGSSSGRIETVNRYLRSVSL